jgi:hypothetical protein
MLSCVLLLAAPGLALAGPLNKRLVGADATWVMHVDVEGALASSIGKTAVQDAEVQEGLRELRHECGVDALKDIKGITLWGLENAEEDTVVIVHTTGVVDDVLEKFREEAGIIEVEEGGYDLLKWTDGAEAQYGHIRRTRRGDDRMVFIARDPGALVYGLKVADGDKPSAASDRAIITDTPGEGAIVFISIPEIATLIPGHAREHVPAFFDKITGVRLEAGERADELFVDAAVTAATSEDAATVQQAAVGGLAMCKLLASGEEDLRELVKFADTIRIASQERTVKFSMRCDAASIRRVIEEANERKKTVKTDVEVEDRGGDAEQGDSPVAPAERKKKGE